MINTEILQKDREYVEKKVIEILQSHSRVCVIRPCSWGKTHLITKLCKQFQGKKLILEPTNVLEHYIEKFNISSENEIIVDTYQNLLKKTKKQLIDMYGDIKYIFLDEVHRCGAKKWGKAIRLLTDAFFDAKVIGMSATPVRTDGNNVIKTIFNETQVSPLFLGDAIKKGMLPNVCYVSALYTITEAYSKMLERLDELKNIGKEEKSLLTNDLKETLLKYEKLNNIPNILQKHLFKNAFHLHNMKFILFCNKVSEIDEVKSLVYEWFYDCYKDTGINKEIRLYDVHYKKGKKINNSTIENFEKEHGENVIDIMVSVNMFNEGLHLNGITGVILLRKTRSNIVYFQQIGRAISQETELPIIFDFVNNYLSVQDGYISLFVDKEYEYDKNTNTIIHRKTKKPFFTKNNEIINIHDETKDFPDIMADIYQKINQVHQKYNFNEVLVKNKSWLEKNSSLYSANELEYKFNLSRKVIEKFLQANNLPYIKNRHLKHIIKYRPLAKKLIQYISWGYSTPEIIHLLIKQEYYTIDEIKDVLRCIHVFSLKTRTQYSTEDTSSIEYILKYLKEIGHDTFSLSNLEYIVGWDFIDKDFVDVLIEIILSCKEKNILPRIRTRNNQPRDYYFKKRVYTNILSRTKERNDWDKFVTELENISYCNGLLNKELLSLIEHETGMTPPKKSKKVEKGAKITKRQARENEVLIVKQEIQKLLDYSFVFVANLLQVNIWSILKAIGCEDIDINKLDIKKIYNITIREFINKDIFYFYLKRFKKHVVCSNVTDKELKAIKMQLSFGKNSIEIAEFLMLNVDVVEKVINYIEG